MRCSQASGLYRLKQIFQHWCDTLYQQDEAIAPFGCHLIRAMKILLINDYGLLAGGAEVIVFSLAREFRRMGHHVMIFSSSAQPIPEPIMADELGFGTTSRWRTLVQAFNPAAALSLRRVLQRFQPDVVHLNLYLTQLSPLILRVLRGYPTIYYAQWCRSICPKGTRLLPNGQECANRPGLVCVQQGCIPLHDGAAFAVQAVLDHHWAPRQLNRVVAISHAVASELNQYGSQHLHGAQVIHPGTRVVGQRKELSVHPSIVMAGRLIREKGADVLINAFRKLVVHHPKAQLQIFGDGPARTSLESLVAKLDLFGNVHFNGRADQVELFSALSHAWVMVVPSVWAEPFGMVSVEAQMQGVAVVASDVGGLAETVQDGHTGFLVPPGNDDALAHRLLSICNNPRTALRLGMNAHDFARGGFSLTRFASDMERTYLEVANTK